MKNSVDEIRVRSFESMNRSKLSPALVGAVAAAYVAVIGGLILVQGCGTGPKKAPVAGLPPTTTATAVKTEVVLPQPAVKPATEEVLPPLHEKEMQSYVVQKGDMLSKIARKFGVTRRELMEANGIKDPNKVRVGQKLSIPTYGGPVSEAKGAGKKSGAAKKPAGADKKAAVTTAAGEGIYEVQAGDSLGKIASKHHTTVKALKEANKLSKDSIHAGQKLILPAANAAKKPTVAPTNKEPVSTNAPVAGTAAAVAPPPAVAVVAAVVPPPAAGVSFDYAVKEGDTFDSIKNYFDVTKQEILALNNLKDDAALRPGMVLKIPARP